MAESKNRSTIWTRWWLPVVVIGSILLLPQACPPTDTTDVSHWNRSGMGLRIDALTGCHYLTGGLYGGITARLDADGEHVCTGEED